jgi:hypothetical protein
VSWFTEFAKPCNKIPWSILKVLSQCLYRTYALNTSHLLLTIRSFEHIPFTFNNQKVPYANTAKYLGMTLDAKFCWKAHVKKKREELDVRYKKTVLADRKELLTVPT